MFDFFWKSSIAKRLQRLHVLTACPCQRMPQSCFHILGYFPGSEKCESPGSSCTPNKEKTIANSRLGYYCIRILLALDLTPELVSQEANGALVDALKEPVSKLQPKKIERASKPAGLLWLWCNSLALCNESVNSNRFVAAKLEEAQVM